MTARASLAPVIEEDGHLQKPFERGFRRTVSP